MSFFVEVDHVDRVFNLPDGSNYVALKHIELKIKQGEFISLIGHSGCGKSTLLNMIAGLDLPTKGGIILEGRQVTKPGPDRMVVFQNYSLLPWQTVRENIALAVNKVFPKLSAGERQGIVEHHIDLVGLRHAADKRPSELSGGMKQRVAIARALAIRPKLLLLDEPFGALDALTRGGLQEQLMKICEESHLTCVMVTHDVDEALLLSDRVVMLTNGPESHIGQILEVPIPRPRHRMEVVNHPDYYTMRNEIIYFLNQQKRDKKRKTKSNTGKAVVSSKDLEKVNLDIGFIPLTDCAPLVVAQEKGFFKKHGFAEVNLVRLPDWKAIAQGITTKRLDAAQMVASMPLAMTIGSPGLTGGKVGGIPVVTALVLSRNGSAITLNKKFYYEGVRNLKDFQAAIAQNPDRKTMMGAVNPASMQNLLLRYWLASGGIDPDRDVSIKIIPPPEMLANLKNGNIDGYCVGEPWNSIAVYKGLGYVIDTTFDIWQGHPEKVLGMREDWVEKYPQTHIALVKALLEACEYCDNPRNRQEILQMLCQPQYIGSGLQYTRPGFLTPYDKGTDEPPQLLPRYHQFHFDNTNCPSRVEGLWILTQLARWGMTPFPKNWVEILERVRRVDLFGEAVSQLGWPDIEPDRQNFSLFDGMVFNPDDPIGYLKRLSIRREIRVAEITIDNPTTEAA